MQWYGFLQHALSYYQGSLKCDHILNRVFFQYVLSSRGYPEYPWKWIHFHTDYTWTSLKVLLGFSLAVVQLVFPQPSLQEMLSSSDCFSSKCLGSVSFFGMGWPYDSFDCLLFCLFSILFWMETADQKWLNHLKIFRNVFFYLPEDLHRIKKNAGVAGPTF